VRRSAVRAFIGILSAALLAIAGCGGGGGGGGGGSPAVASATALIVTPGDDGETTLVFEVIETAGSPQTVEIEFSVDRGASYSTATLSGLTGGSFEAAPGGGTYELTWLHSEDLAASPQSDLRLRVTPFELSTGRQGVAAVSPVFGIGANTAPSILAVTTPSGVNGGRIAIPFVVADAQSDHVGIDLEYSLDGGGTWQSGSIASGAESIATSPAGSSATALWDATEDVAATASSLARVRLTAVDIARGTSLSSSNFTVLLIDPVIDSITVGAIPDSMNGSTPYEDASDQLIPFTLRVPLHGFSLAVETDPGPGGAAVSGATLEVVADRDLAGAAAGTDLGPLFSGTASRRTWLVASSHALPIGPITFSARVQDIHGNISAWQSITLDGHPGSAGNLPFDWLDRWWLDFDSDQFAISSSGTSTIAVTATAGANGTPDHIEDLRIVGLQSVDPLPECAAFDSNGRVRGWVEEEVCGRLRELFGADFDGTVPGFAPNIDFSFTQPGTTSSIRIGGDDIEPGYTLGRAAFDHRNAVANVNRGGNLGVFTTNMIQFYVNSYLFRQRFQLLMPGLGVPVGEDAWDVIVLAPGFDRSAPGNPILANYRYDSIWYSIEAWGRSVAVITAHEIGHSIGLCSGGAPPAGLFGGLTSATFSGPYTTMFHLDTPGNNLMASALSFTTSMVQGPSGYRFNELNEAYLRQWTLIGN